MIIPCYILCFIPENASGAGRWKKNEGWKGEYVDGRTKPNVKFVALFYWLFSNRGGKLVEVAGVFPETWLSKCQRHVVVKYKHLI